MWDSHAGFEPEPDADPGRLERWRASDVDCLSVSVAYDRRPWRGSLASLLVVRVQALITQK